MLIIGTIKTCLGLKGTAFHTCAFQNFIFHKEMMPRMYAHKIVDTEMKFIGVEYFQNDLFIPHELKKIEKTVGLEQGRLYLIRHNDRKYCCIKISLETTIPNGFTEINCTGRIFLRLPHTENLLNSYLVELENEKLNIEMLEKLSSSEAKNYRDWYIRLFVNTDSEYYKDYLYLADGYFLWSCFNKQGVAKSYEFVKYGVQLDKEVYFFWDFYDSSSKMFELGGNCVYRMNFRQLVDNLDSFPQDLYIFDKSMKWSLAETHETQNEFGDRFIWIE